LFAAIFQVLFDLLNHIGSQWQATLLTALGLASIEFKVRRGFGIQEQLPKRQAAQFLET
jgi:hypothetical protein